MLTHTKACVAKAAASADCPPAGRILPGDYSVVGMQPKCKPRPPHKAKAKPAPLDPDAPLEGDAEVEGVESGAVEADVGDESMLWEEEEMPDAVEAATEKDLGVEASVPAKKKAEESLGGPVKKPRFMTGQKTDEQLKFYMPAIATPDYISIRQDDLSKFFFQARYDHTTNTAQADLDAGKVAALPLHLK